MLLRLSVAVAILASAAGAQEPRRAEFEAVTDDPDLPRVLIIGDSISIGYTLPLRAALKGVANVHRPPENCRHTWRGLEMIDEWLGPRASQSAKWDLIHFNWGLHDLKYVDAKGQRALPPKGKQVSTLKEYETNLEKLVQRLEIDEWLGPRASQSAKWDLIHFNWGLHDLKYVDKGQRALPPKGKQVSTLKEYETNLEKLVQRLEKTGARLIWRPTTPVPEGADGRYSDLPKFNKASRKVIDRHGIQVDDMNAFIAAKKIPHRLPDDVHFTPEASAQLAANSAAVIRRALGR